MEARNPLRWIVAVVIILGAPAVSWPAYNGQVHTYHVDFELPIPAPDQPESEFGKGWMADAIINVTGHMPISDLDVSVSLTHDSLFDLQILLVSPSGTGAILNPAGNLAFIVRGQDGSLTRVGGSFQFLFDDEATVSIEDATEPFVGPFSPIAPLSSLHGQDAFGPWRLRIYDAFYADTGTLNSFELIVTTPEPTTAILLMLGTALMMVSRPRRKSCL
jgi:subtilisin-like proprotein convertase family protein